MTGLIPLPKLPEIHCSDLPRIMACPASLVPPQVRIIHDSEAARIGRAVHEALAKSARKEPAYIVDIAAKHSVNTDQVAPLFYAGLRIWEEYRDSLKLLAVEYSMKTQLGNIMLVGTGDIIAEVLGEEANIVALLDWKSGTTARGHRDQLIGYGRLAQAEWPEAEQIKIITVWLRDQLVEIEDIDQAELDDWRKRWDYALSHPNTYQPSYENCEFCGRRHECSARTALVRTSINDFLVTKSKKELTPARLASLYPQAKLLDAALKSYHATLRNALHGVDSLPLGNGREIALIEKTRETVDPLTLLSEMHAKDAAPAMSVNKSKLAKLIAAKAPRGEKGKRITEFMERLDQAGGVTRTTHHAIQVRKVVKE